MTERTTNDPRFLNVLRCPCSNSLEEDASSLRCHPCGSVQVKNAFGYEWRRGSEFGMSGETKPILDEWQLSLLGWTGEVEYAAFLRPFKTILDARCGIGREVVRLARLNPNALIVGGYF